MVAEKDESSRNLLDKIEGDWDSPSPPRAAATPEVQAALDAAAARLVDSLDPPPVSVPTMDELDSGWDEEDEEDDEEDDEDEPELPDERLDPVAYALAKKAREERIEARRARRRAKVEAKKARRKARIDAQRSKQKGKQKKARPAPKPARPSKEERNRARKAAAAESRTRGTDDDHTTTGEGADDDDELQPSSLPSRAKAKLPPSKPMSGSKPMLSKTNQWMLAVAVVIFLAAAIFAAVVTR
ncbi:MAG: hypothetical protein JWO86_5920 [Myxococcaceae bacterium]|nr:hypothetical protein [Myxococcaceae bacterium]